MTQLDDLDSIASFEASLTYNQQVTAVTVRQLSSALAVPTTEGSGATAVAPTDGTQAGDSFIDQLSRVAEPLDSDNNFEKIPRRFAQLFNKLTHQLLLDAHDENLAKRIASDHSRHGRGHGHHSDGQTQQVG